MSRHLMARFRHLQAAAPKLEFPWMPVSFDDYDYGDIFGGG